MIIHYISFFKTHSLKTHLYCKITTKTFLLIKTFEWYESFAQTMINSSFTVLCQLNHMLLCKPVVCGFLACSICLPRQSNLPLKGPLILYSGLWVICKCIWNTYTIHLCTIVNVVLFIRFNGISEGQMYWYVLM